MDSRPHNGDNTRLILAVALIVIGGLWMLKKLGIYIEFQPFFYDSIFYPIKQLFHRLIHAIFSWPMILIIIGAILLAGRRSGGIVLLVIGGIFLIPKLLFLNGITVTILLPVLLVGLGVAMVTRVI